MGDCFKHIDCRTEGALFNAGRLITHLLYADEPTRITAAPGLLQLMLGTPEVYARRNHLTVNVQKPTFMVFRPY